MGVRIFLAGASGVIGRPLARLLQDQGHTVTGTSRTPQGAKSLRDIGVDAVIVDVFDPAALERAVVASAPEVVIHQLTSLAGFDPASPNEAIERNARLRREGTANLVRAARAAGAQRLVAQSIAWAYAPKTPPYRETDPLDLEAVGARAVTVRQGVAPLEHAVLDQAGMEGLVLRYGQLYGPGTWSQTPTGASPLHVDAAVYTALLAVDHGRPGAYNIADKGGEVSIEKAVSELGWKADFRLSPP